MTGSNVLAYSLWQCKMKFYLANFFLIDKDTLKLPNVLLSVKGTFFTFNSSQGGS